MFKNEVNENNENMFNAGYYSQSRVFVSLMRRKSKWKTKGEEKKKIVIISCFRFIPIDQILCFRFNSKTRKTAQNCFLIHI